MERCKGQDFRDFRALRTLRDRRFHQGRGCLVSVSVFLSDTTVTVVEDKRVEVSPSVRRSNG